MRKLCTDEGGGVNMKKFFENVFCNFLKRIFFNCSFLAAPLALHFQDDLYSLRRRSYNILNNSRWRTIDKDLPK